MNSRILILLSTLSVAGCSLDKPDQPATAQAPEKTVEQPAPESKPEPEPAAKMNLQSEPQAFVTMEVEKAPEERIPSPAPAVSPEESSILRDLRNGAFDSTNPVRDLSKPVDLSSLQHRFWFAGLQTRLAGERAFFTRLIEKPEQLQERDEDGLTLTHHLALLGKVRLLKLLSEYGISTFAEVDLKGRYPAHYSSTPETAEFLFANTKVSNRRSQLDPALTLTDKDGKLPLHVMIERGQTNAAIAVIHRLCTFGLFPLIYGTGLNTPDQNGRTAVHFAAIANDLAVMDQLIFCGIVDREVRDNRGRSALHYASEHADFSVGYALVGRNHSISAAQRSADKNGDKAVDIARKSKNAAGVNILTRLNN